MTDSPLWQFSAVEQAGGVARGDWSAEELTRATLDRIDEANPQLGAYCTINPAAIEDARAVDRRLAAGGPPRPLEGVPFSVKDLIPTAGLRTTLGSVAHSDWVPDDDEISVARVRAAGGILLGKTNTRELGYGVVADNELFGPTRNPWDPRMTAAGSSGGAAAAISAGMGAIALGSDGGGSLRVPAAVCGVFSIKPSYGVVPLYPSSRAALRVGLDSWESLECIGPITRTVADSAATLAVIAGFDARDRHAVPVAPSTILPRDDRGLSVVYSPDLGVAEVDPRIAALTFEAVKAVAELEGWALRVTSPGLAPLVELRETFAATVAMDTDLDALRELADRYAVSPDIRELVDRAWTTRDFGRARGARRALFDAMREFGAPYDVILTPTTATTAFPVGQRHPENGVGGISSGPQWSPFAFVANLTGQPAASIPIGLVGGLPVGVQVIGRRFDDATVLDVAAAFERVRPWRQCFAAPA